MRDNKLLRNRDSHKEEEKTKLEQLQDEARNSIFGVFYILLKKQENTLWKYSIVIIIEFLQVLSYVFNAQMSWVWKSPDIIRYVAEFLSTFRITYWIQKLEYDIYVIIYYVCIFLIFLIVIDFVYVAYAYKHRKFAFLWPIQILKVACVLLSTFLYIPLAELFMSFSKCGRTDSGKIMHKIFKDVECFQSIHILHVATSYLLLILMIGLTLLIIKCLYESRLSRDPVAQTNSICSQLSLAAKTAYVFFFTFFDASVHYWATSVILFSFSILTFYLFFSQRPYYNESMTKIVNVLNGIFLWACTMLIFSCMIINIDFSGNLAIFLMGLPFTVMILLNKQDVRKEKLMQSIHKFDQGKQIQQQIAYYIALIENKENSRDSAVTLKGYVNHHSEFCVLDDCPLKNFKKQMMKDQRKSYAQFGQTQTMYTAMSAKNQVTSLESHPLLISQAKNLYLNGIKKFPLCNGLKIDFASFLLNKMHNKKEALRELMNAEKQNPSFEEQFMIFRYRQIIEDELHEGSDSSSGGLDYVAAINFQQHYSLFKSTIEKSALLHCEFWNHLMDDSPDLGKLAEQGSKINISINLVEDQWKKLTQQSTQTAKALRLYASYLIEIINDKELGNEQLAKAKETAVHRANFDFNNINEDGTDMASFAPDGTPCVYVSGETEKLGIMTQCNLSVCRVFGFTKKEDLVNHEVELLMPRIYQRQHKSFLEQALQKPPDLLSAKERPVFGKHFSGYIFPIWLSIKNMPSFLQGRQFVGTFKLEKNGINKNVAHLILDKNKEVIDISSSCIQMLGLDLHKLTKKKAKFDIAILLPTLFGANYYQFVNKTGCQIEYFFPELVELDKQVENNAEEEHQDENFGDHLNDGQPDQALRPQSPYQNDSFARDEEEDSVNGAEQTSIISIQKKGGGMSPGGLSQIIEESRDDEEEEMGKAATEAYEFKVVASSKSVNFQCNMTEIHFETPNVENPNPGYYIRLETSFDKQSGAAKVQKALKQTAFQFAYDPIYKKFQRELRDKENKDFLIDKNYLALKKLKEANKTEGSNTSQRLANMTYMNYLVRYQKWIEKGQVGNILDDNMSENTSNASLDEDDDDNEKRENTTAGGDSGITPTANVTPTGLGFDIGDDLKRFIPGEGSGKEFLKQEHDRMIAVLRKKHEAGQGIHIASLFAGRSSDKGSDLDDDDDAKDEDSEKDKGRGNDLKHSIKSRKAFQMAINDKAMPSSIKRLSRIVNLMLICLLALAISDYSIVFKQVRDTRSNFVTVGNSYRRTAEIQKVCYNVRSLIMLNQALLTNYYGFKTRDELVKSINDDLQKSLNQLYTIQNEINLSQLQVSNENQQILDEKTVTLAFKQDGADMTQLQFSLTEAILQVQSSIFTVSNLGLSMFSDQNQDVFFLMYNSFNQLYQAMSRSSTLYVMELGDRSKQKEEVCLILFICSIAVLVLVIIVMIPVVTSVNQQKDKVLSLFCEIDSTSVRILYQRCEKFSTKLQTEDANDEIDSNDEFENIYQKEEDDDYGLLSGQSKRSARAKNSTRSERSFYVKFVFALLIIEAYYAYSYYSERDYGKTTRILSSEFNNTNIAESYYWFSLNTERELFYNPSKLILQQNSFQVSKASIVIMYDLNDDWQNLHLSNEKYLEQEYWAVYEKIMRTDLCVQSQQTYFSNMTECESFISGAVSQGMSTVIIRYIDTLKNELSLYQKAVASNITGIAPTNPINFTSAVNTSIKAIINSQDMKEAYVIQHDFVQPFYRTLADQLSSSIQGTYDVMSQRRLFLLIFYLVLILLAYVSIWIPLVSNLNNEIYKTKLMLMIIPLEILMRMKNVGKVLQSQNFVQEKSRTGPPGRNGRGRGNNGSKNNN